MNQELKIKADKALTFLRNHPAFYNESISDSLWNGAWFMMAQCSRHGKALIGKPEDQNVQVYTTDERFAEFKDRYWDKEDGEPTELDMIYVPYEAYYGEPWKFDHVEFWYETVFFVYHGPHPSDGHIIYNPEMALPKNYLAYSGPDGGACSFEEMLIDAAVEVKEAFGNFDLESFYTEEELENNKNHSMFLNNSYDKVGCLDPKINPEYIFVPESLMNSRWLAWFMKTEYAKKYWKHDFEAWKNLLKKRNVSYVEPQHAMSI